MEERKERKFVCKYCYKQFPSGKSLGGHIRIHTNENSVDSDRYNGNMNKRLVDHQREIQARKQQQQQKLCCIECGKGFVSLKALCIHMACHSEKEKKLMDSQSDTETYSAPTKKRSKRVVMKQSNSESFSNGSSSFGSEIDQDDRDGAYNLVRMSRDSSFKKGHNLVMNSLGESSDNSVIVETKSSSREELKNLNGKNEVLETDKVAVIDELRSADDNGVVVCDSDYSDADYFMNGPKKSDSGFSVNRSLINTGFASQFNNSLKRFKNSDEKRSKYERSRSNRRVPSYETDSCADTYHKIHRFIDTKTAMVKKAADEKKKSKGHKCPICLKVFKSGQALGGHKRSHNQEHTPIAEMRNKIDLNLPGSDSDE